MPLYYKKKRKKIFLFFSIFITILIIFYFIFFKFSPIFYDLSTDKVYSIVFEIINQSIYDNLENMGNNSLIQYQYNNAGEINAVNANVVIMNQLNNEISTEIIQKLSALENIYVQIPLGSIFGMNFIAGIGPKIPIKIVPLNTFNTEYRTEFTSSGINQTRHKVYIKINCDVNVLSNISSEIQTIDIEVPIAETIIIGNVPSTYFESGKQTALIEKIN